MTEGEDPGECREKGELDRWDGVDALLECRIRHGDIIRLSATPACSRSGILVPHPCYRSCIYG